MTWLEDIVKQAETVHEEMVAMIEVQKAAMDEMHDNFLPALSVALESDDSKEMKLFDRKRQARDLLSHSQQLLDVYKSANDSIASAFGGENPLEAMEKTHEQDVQKLKEVMLAGKRICAGDLERVLQQARAKELMGRKEVFEQAAGIFRGPVKGQSVEGVERTLSYAERGVRRMVKGIE